MPIAQGEHAQAGADVVYNAETEGLKEKLV